MALLNYRTRISADVTVGEIQKLLAKAGASAIMSNYDQQGNIVALSFQLILDDKPVSFTLPTDWRPVQEKLRQQKTAERNSSIKHDEATSRNVAWRITKDWVEAQLAIIETRMVVAQQVFLPYMVTSSGKSLFEYMESKSYFMLEDGV